MKKMSEKKKLIRKYIITTENDEFIFIDEIKSIEKMTELILNYINFNYRSELREL